MDTTTYNIPLTAIVVAHELAHNLGSDHDGPGANVLCPASTFIMSPGIGPGLNLANFSSCSVADIETTIAAIATPELCMDFPTDVSMAENAGNNGALNANLEFTSSYTATIENGYKAVDWVNLSGTVNTAQGILIAVVANGVNCTINGGGGAYSCTVSNPPTSFQVTANVRVNANTSNIIITQTIDEDTVDVQEVNTSNNSLLSTCDIANNMVMCSATSVSPIAPTTPTMNPGSMSEDEGGGGGNYNLGLLLLMFGIYIQVRRQRLK